MLILEVVLNYLFLLSFGGKGKVGGGGGVSVRKKKRAGYVQNISTHFLL